MIKKFKIYICIIILFSFYFIIGCFGNQDDHSLLSQIEADPLITGKIPYGTASLGGFVVSNSNNKFNSLNYSLSSVYNAKVFLLELGIFTYTDKNGYYEFLGIPPGNYTVFAQHVNTDGILYINFIKATAKLHQKTLINESIVLKQTSAITGRITLLNSNDLNKVVVTLENLPFSSSVSDDGYFQLINVPSEQFVNLIISASGYVTKKYGPISILEGTNFIIKEPIVLDAENNVQNIIIGGSILDSLNNALISNVLIKVYKIIDNIPLLYKTYITDSKGKYSISLLTNNKYSFEFIHSNYFTQTTEIIVNDNKNINKNFYLKPIKLNEGYYKIYGKIYDEDNNVISKAKVYTIPYIKETLTSDDGYYSLDLPSGVYKLCVYKPEYFLSTTEIIIRSTITLPNPINLTLKKDKFSKLYPLYGTIIDKNNNPLKAKLFIDKYKLYTYTNESGAYTFYLNGGTYEILIEGVNFKKQIETFIDYKPTQLDVQVDNFF